MAKKMKCKDRKEILKPLLMQKSKLEKQIERNQDLLEVLPRLHEKIACLVQRIDEINWEGHNG